MHLFLWIALDRGREAPRASLDSAAYLTVVSLISNKEPVPIPQSRRPEKPPAIRNKETVAEHQKIKTRPLGNDRVTESISPLSPSTEGESSKKIKSLDYDAMDRTVRSIAHESNRRLLPGIDRKLSKGEKFSEAMGQAKRGECRWEYAGTGLLAIPLLLRDTITGEGCQW